MSLFTTGLFTTVTILVLVIFPEDWKYYTLTFPVARYKHLSLGGIIDEMISCDQDFYSMPHILRRVWSSLCQRRKPLISLVGDFSYRNNLWLNRKAYADFKSYVKAGVWFNRCPREDFLPCLKGYH